MLTFVFIKYKLLRKIIKKMKAEGIFENHRIFIKAWLSYLDQKEFAIKLEKQMLTEIKRYLKTRNKTKGNIILDYIIEVVWNETDTEAWIIVVAK